MTILVIDSEFLISLYFRKNATFPLISEYFSLNSLNLPVLCLLYVFLASSLLWPWCIYASCNARIQWTPL